MSANKLRRSRAGGVCLKAFRGCDGAAMGQCIQISTLAYIFTLNCNMNGYDIYEVTIRLCVLILPTKRDKINVSVGPDNYQDPQMSRLVSA